MRSRLPPEALRGQRGSSLVEFIIIAPIVMLLCYMAYDLNKRAEEMGTVTVVSRNLAHRPDSESDSRKREILAKPFKEAWLQIDRKVRAAFANFASRGEVEDGYKMHQRVVDNLEYDSGEAASFGVSRDRLTTPGEAKPRGENGVLSHGNIQSVTDNLLAASKQVDVILDTMRWAQVAPEDGIRIGEASVLVPGRDNDMQAGLSVLANSLSEGSGTKVLDNDRAFADRYFLRPETGFHTNQFTQGPLAGAALGFGMHGKWDDYSNECMNKFNATSSCNPTNEFALLVGGIGVAKSIAMCVADFFSGGSASSAQSTAQTTFETAMDALMTKIVDMVVENGLKMVMKQVEDQLGGAVGNVLSNIGSNVQTAITADGKGIENLKGIGTQGEN